jgi:GH15 family glucan-1,4-alpha-glucosidase
LLKHIDGPDEVDSALLWACVPFGRHALFTPTEPIMRATAARIEQDLVGRSGGVYRYRADTYYGGGEWLLLAGLLGEYRASIGDREGAQHCLAFVEANANEAGELPEQITDAALHPSKIAEWITRWGSVAQPLLWSHANYLSLYARLKSL